MNGAAIDLLSDCKDEFKVINVRALDVLGVSFKSSIDHSKWAVSANETSQDDWVCIGDINRQKSQELRGGGTTCFENPQVASLYKSAISSAECCDEGIICSEKVSKTKHQTRDHEEDQNQ